MNVKSCLAALSLCLLPLVSQAGVIYEWRALNNETPRGITLQLEFEQSTIDSGAFSYVFQQDFDFETPLPGSGLLGLHYAFPGVSEEMRYSWQKGFDNQLGFLEMELSFDKGGFLSGYIYANNTQHHFMMSSTGNRFTVLDANSDEGMPGAECGWTVGIDCTGAVGQIRRADIPEPGSLALLGIGLLGAASLRRKTVR
ncbi:PEP-CTERM sorting domain-containing protein [Massilia sp. SYSU DXS3249]